MNEQEPNAIVVFMTSNNADEAAKIAEILVERKLAACVQILPPMTSVYQWMGEVQRDTEHLLLAKTTDARFAELEKTVRENHSYDVPEIVAVAAHAVSKLYLNWLVSETVR
jgi:periplasmic divalent cation tolerance protein